VSDVVDELNAFMVGYERATNSHEIEQLAPLIAAEAVYWFSDGSHHGRTAVLSAIEATFAAIREEVYRISDLEWVIHGRDHAVCRYRFSWTGLVAGSPRSGRGRGTNVVINRDGRWLMLHEHLSS
jgi:ketosteroid isomerase-like protein